MTHQISHQAKAQAVVLLTVTPFVLRPSHSLHTLYCIDGITYACCRPTFNPSSPTDFAPEGLRDASDQSSGQGTGGGAADSDTTETRAHPLQRTGGTAIGSAVGTVLGAVGGPVGAAAGTTTIHICEEYTIRYSFAVHVYM